MKELGKKLNRSHETVSEYAYSYSAQCSCYCSCWGGRRYSESYQVKRSDTYHS
jgi:putative bacteriocin precursor